MRTPSRAPSLSGLVTSLCCLFALPAWADAEPEFSLGLGTLRYLSFSRASQPLTTLELAYARTLGDTGLARGLRLGGGLRTGWPAASTHAPLEGFVQVQLLGRWGFYEAGVGAELGVTGFAKLFEPPFVVPVELNGLEDARMSPVYGAFSATPVRLRWGPVRVSLLELRLGTGVPFSGQAVRVQLGLLRVGAVL